MKRSSRTIKVQAGHREFIKLNARRVDWRDIYHLVLTLTWPQFAGMILGIYLLINLIFAGLYLLGQNCIAELVPGSFTDHFFFSVETLATVGYGHAYPASLYGHCVATLEISSAASSRWVLSRRARRAARAGKGSRGTGSWL